MSLNDIKTDLDEDINSFEDFEVNKISANIINNNHKKNNKKEEDTLDTSDIRKKVKKIDLIKNKFIRIMQNNTRNFDGIIIKTRLKDINLKQKSNFPLVFNKNPFNRNYLSLKNIIRPYFLKKVGIIFIAFILFLLIDKFIVEYNINSGYKKIISLKESKNIQDAQLLVNNAKLNFIIWDFLFKPFLLIPNNNIEIWYNIIAWWKRLASLWDNLLQIYVDFSSFINGKWLNNVLISNLLLNLRSDFIKTEKNLDNTLYYYDKIKNINNDKIKDKFILWVNYLRLFKNKLSIINKDYDSFLNIFWHSYEKTYLILFQNNDEIRATWGFMWSIGIIKIFKWQITDFKTKDIYAIEWDLKKSKYKKLKAPKGINRLTDNFWLRDSNYYANIEKSSNSIKYFIEKSWIDIDWILYLNKNLILDFLKITWSVDIKDIWETITDENFSRMMSLLVEAKIFQKWTLWTPKQILFDFIDNFKNKLLTDKDYFNYLKVIFKNIISRDIMFYSFNPKENLLLTKLWVNWFINYSKYLDFNYVIYTSISWNKSGRYMKRTYTKEIKQNGDCSIKTNLNIKSKHTYNKIEENKLKNIIKKYNIKDLSSTLYIQWAWENRQYVRVLLPKDSIVKKSKKYKIYNQKDFTMLEFFLTTRPWEIVDFNINYTIKNKVCKKYDYIFYKQAWIKDYDFIIKNTKKDNIQKNWIDKDFTYNIWK